MTGQQPDIEIYVKHADPKAMQAWLEKHFSLAGTTLSQLEGMEDGQPFTLMLSLAEGQIELMVTPKAAGKAYTSFWFKSSDTPWNSDLECAQSVLLDIDTEVRCSSEGWQEDEAEHSDKWWKLTRETQTLVPW